MAESKNLKTAVDKEVKVAEKKVETGNLITSDAPPQTPDNPLKAPATGDHSRR